MARGQSREKPATGGVACPNSRGTGLQMSSRCIRPQPPVHMVTLGVFSVNLISRPIGLQTAARKQQFEARRCGFDHASIRCKRAAPNMQREGGCPCLNFRARALATRSGRVCNVSSTQRVDSRRSTGSWRAETRDWRMADGRIERGGRDEVGPRD